MELLQKKLLGAMISIIQKINSTNFESYDSDSKEYSNKSIWEIHNGFNVCNNQKSENGVGFRIVLKVYGDSYIGYINTSGDLTTEDCTQVEFVNAVFENFDTNNYFLGTK